MEKIEHMSSIKEKLAAASKSGYSGSSILNRLYYLYRFNPCHDLVRDVMHMVPMNCAKKVFKRIITENIQRKEELAKRLEEFPYSQGKDK